jgi:hypothetical protein
MPRVFISYRRNDTAALAYRIFEKLEEKFGRDCVFMDTGGIPIGVDFRDYISSAIDRTDLTLAVIGPHWLAACRA